MRLPRPIVLRASCAGILIALGAFGAHRVRAADSLMAPTAVTHFTFDSIHVSGATVLDQAASNHATSYVQNTGTPGAGTRTATAPVLVPGVFGQAMSLNGTTQYAEANGAAALNLAGAGGFTIAAWFNRGSVGETLAVPLANSQFYLQWEPTPRTIGYLAAPTAWSTSTTSSLPPVNNWHHIAMVFDDTANTFRLYENGVVQPTGGPLPTGTPTFQEAFQNLYIGAYSGATPGNGYFMNGLIDELWVFHEPLTQEQLNNLIQVNDIAGPPAPLAPEPTSAALFVAVLGCGAAHFWRRRRRHLPAR